MAQSAVLQRRARRSGLDVTSGTNNGNEFVGRGQTESDDDVEKRAGEFLAAAVRKVQEQGVDPETALLKVNSILRDRVLRAEKLAEGVALSELSVEDREQIWERAR